MNSNDHQLLLEVRAFRNYISNLVDDEALFSTIFNDGVNIAGNISYRWEKLEQKLIRQGIRDLVSVPIDPSGPDIIHLRHELGYVEEILLSRIAAAVERETDRQREAGNAPFEAAQVTRIHAELENLRATLYEHIERSGELPMKKEFIKQVVSSEVADLKEEATRIGRKDWKNHLIAFALNLALLFGFSTDARSNLYSAYDTLLVICYESTADTNMVPPPEIPGKKELGE